jgi:hypothetical protein
MKLTLTTSVYLLLLIFGWSHASSAKFKQLHPSTLLDIGPTPSKECLVSDTIAIGTEYEEIGNQYLDSYLNLIRTMH